MRNILSAKNIASFTLIFMSVQFVGIESIAISMPKVVFMSLSPLLLMTISPKISKAIILSVIFWTFTFLLNQIQFENQRVSTFYYSLLFLSVFCLYYNLVWCEACFTIDDFLQIIKIIIFSYFIFLILQQVAMLLGRRYFPLVNLIGSSWQSLFRLNSLAIEPSHAARVLTVYFYAFLKLTEIKFGHPLSIKEMYVDYKWLVVCFLYTMLAIGSGTAMAGLAILALYFIKKQYVVILVFAFFLVYFVSHNLEYKPLNRAINTMEAAMTLDEDEIADADKSASSRVNLLVNIIKYTDLDDPQTWLGHGTNADHALKHITHGAIYNYGLISYLLKLLLFFSCAFCGVFSLSTLMFILLFTMNIGNIAYGFACLMVFSTVKFFQQVNM